MKKQSENKIMESDPNQLKFEHILDGCTLFKAVLHASSEAVAISDPTGRILYINPAHEKLFGRSLEQAGKANYRDYYPPESIEVLNKEVAPALEKGRTWEGVLDAFDAKGRRFPLWERADTIRDKNGNMLYAFGIMHDVTQEREKERLLQNSRELFEKTFETQQSAILLLGTGIPPKIIKVNKAFTRIFQYTPEEVLDLTTSFLHVNAETLAEFQKQFYPMIEAQGFCQLSDFLMKRKDGSVFPTDISVMPLKDDQGRRIGWVSVIRDLTKRKQIEAGLRENEQMYRTLFEQNLNPIAIIDTRGQYLDANQAFLEFVEKTRDQLLQMYVFDFAPSDKKNRQETDHMPIWKTGGSLEAEYSVAGSIKILELTVTPIQYRGIDAIVGVGKDITDRKRAEENLRKVQQLLQDVIDKSTSFIVVKDAMGKFTLMNETCRNFLGIQKDQWKGKTDYDVFSKEIAEKNIKEDEEVIRTGNTLYIEESVSGNGGLKTFWTMKYPLRDTEGRIYGIGVIITDITGRKQAEDELKQTQERLNAILNNLTDMVLETDETMTVLWANKEALKYNPAAVGKKCYEAFGNQKRTQPCVGCPCYKSLLTGQIEQDIVHQPAAQGISGETYWHNIGIPIKNSDEKVIRLIEVSRNVTKEKQAENALIESRARLVEAQSLAHIGNWTWDIERQRLTWSDEVYRIFGVEVNSFQPSAEALESMIHPDDREDFLSRRARMLDEKQSAEIDHRIVRPSGEIRYVQERAQTILHEDGRVLRVIGTVQDITDRKQAEAARVKYEEQKSHLQKAKSLSRMAGAIAHRFNNQLTAVIGNLEMAMDNLSRHEGISQKLVDALHAAQKAAEVSGMMLTYLGQTPGNRDRLDLSDLCRQSLPKLFAAKPEETDFLTDLPFPGPVISANADQMRQVLTHLFTNAVESLADGRGNIRLHVKTVSPEEISTVHCFPVNWQPQGLAHACLELADTGCGILESNFENLFDPFFSTQFPGRGLGLSVVLGIVQAHGGGITVESRSGQGSVFRLFFPVAEPSLPTRPDTPQTGKINKKSESEKSGVILVADDEDMVRRVIEAMLRKIGFDVLTARDGIEAVETFRKNKERIVLVISDLSMPRMNGWETLTALRKLEPNIPVILASGYDEAHVMKDEYLERPQAFLKKPYTRGGLEEALAGILSDDKK